MVTVHLNNLKLLLCHVTCTMLTDIGGYRHLVLKTPKISVWTYAVDIQSLLLFIEHEIRQLPMYLVAALFISGVS